MSWTNEDLQAVREMIYHESTVTNHRITWLLQIEGFLFAALAFSWDTAPEITWVVAVVGIIVSLSVMLALAEAADARRELGEQWTEHKPKNYDGPGPVGYQAPLELRRRWVHPWRLLPVLFAAAWVTIIAIRALTLWCAS